MTSVDTTIELLAATTLFGTLPEPDRAAIAERLRPSVFEAGQLVFSRGDEARELFLVSSGRVRLSILSSEGREVSLTHATAGDIFGEIALLDGGRRSADATAISAVRAHTLSRAALDGIMRDHPAVAAATIRYLCRLLRETDNKIESIALHSIEGRLARFLLSAMKLQAPDQPLKRRKLVLGMSQSELALLLGASRPKVNVALTNLEVAGAIARTPDGFICDPDGLAGYAGEA